MTSRQKIVVTGGSGYIGSHTIIEILEKTDFDVISIDNYSNSLESTYDRIKTITGKPFRYYNIDLCDREKTMHFFENEKNIVGIIHFAAFKSVPESVTNPEKYYSNNIDSLKNILDACIEFNIQHFIFSSSCSVYGNIESLPVQENSKLNPPESPYADTKKIGETILADIIKNNPTFKGIALRYFNPVGAHVSGLNGELPINKPSNLVPVITQTAIGKIKVMTVYGNDYNTRDGSCVRDYVHVSDIASAHVIALDYLLKGKNKENFSVFNLGTGNGVTVLEAIHSFEKTSGVKLNYTIGERRKGDVVAIYSETSKSENELGWKPKFSLDEMMETAWKWELNLQKESSK